jgi:leader peptidase (prepilin peptidase)/N-methyltransferase
MGLILGWPKILVSLFFAFFSGAVVGLILIFLKRKTMKSQIPFAPFLVSGTFFAMLFGDKIIDWYLRLILLK